jgi:hypothetical protein
MFGLTLQGWWAHHLGLPGLWKQQQQAAPGSAPSAPASWAPVLLPEVGPGVTAAGSPRAW